MADRGDPVVAAAEGAVAKDDPKTGTATDCVLPRADWGAVVGTAVAPAVGAAVYDGPATGTVAYCRSPEDGDAAALYLLKWQNNVISC